VVLISHDHYDHLDRSTIRAMRAWDTRFVVPLGVGGRLRQWGIAATRITELDWWQSLTIDSLEITATPARHASGRGLLDKDQTLWAGYALRGPRHRVYFSGDTGLFPGLKEIGDRLGPFTLTFLEIGAYSQAWPDWHLGPEQAVQAHLMLRGEVMVPIHWGLFNLSSHGWTEPVERLLMAAQAQGVQVRVPRPGERCDLPMTGSTPRWWPKLPWRSAQEMPIRTSRPGE
jgi:L-ascorbate metabolism protein UlaG (beta-lactamase superfamily)